MSIHHQVDTGSTSWQDQAAYMRQSEGIDSYIMWIVDPRDRRAELAAQAIAAYHGLGPDAGGHAVLHEDDIELDAAAFEFAAAHGIVLLPVTMPGGDGEPVNLHRTDTIEFMKLLRHYGIEAKLYPADDGLIAEEALCLCLPEVLITAQQVLASPEVIKNLVEIAWIFVKDSVGNMAASNGKCTLDISVVRANGSRTRVKYEGPSSGLSDVVAAVKAAATRKK